MILTFSEWIKIRESSDIPKGGWSKHTTVPVGLTKDTHPEHPKNAVDPEKNPKKHRGKIHIHVHSPDYSPGHPKNAVDPHKRSKKK